MERLREIANSYETNRVARVRDSQYLNKNGLPEVKGLDGLDKCIQETFLRQ